MRTVSIAFTTLCLVSAVATPPAHANDFTRADVWALVNRDAKNWLLDADDFRLDIETVRIPRRERESGKVCGPIIPLSRKPYPNAKGSYVATLWIENGKLQVGSMTPFFMQIDELMADTTCK